MHTLILTDAELLTLYFDGANTAEGPWWPQLEVLGIDAPSGDARETMQAKVTAIVTLLLNSTGDGEA